MQGFPSPRQPVPAPARQRSAPVIEEVGGDEDNRATRRADNHPIVEEPDEDGSYEPRQHQRPRRSSPQRARAVPGSSVSLGGNMYPQFNSSGNSGGTVFSFSSSSYTSSTAPGGVTYTATSTTRMGPGGVRETHQTVRDGRTGQESITISRGLGEKERTVNRTRLADGREHTNDVLRGISAEEAARFDEHWRREAERSLVFGRGPGRVAGYQPQSQQYALPSSASAPSHANVQQQTYQRTNSGQYTASANKYQSTK